MSATHKITASKLPYITKCFCFEFKPTPPGPAALRGTNMDTCLRWWIQNPEAPVDIVADVCKPKHLKPNDYDNIAWAKNEILSRSSDHKCITEKSKCKLRFVMEDVLVTGEMDAMCPEGMAAFDLKSGKVRQHLPQMLPYCKHLLDLNPSATQVHSNLVYCDQKLVDHQVLSSDQVHATLAMILIAWTDPGKKPTQNDYCAYCIHSDLNNRCRYKAK